MFIFFEYFVICWWLICSNVSVFGTYCLISPLAFSIALFCHEAYGSVKIDVDTKAFAYQFMASEFSTVVSCNRLDMLFEWGQQMYYNACQIFDIIPLFEFSHKQHTCTALYQCHNGPMISSSNNRVHLKVPKAFSVNFSRSLTDACSIGYYCCPVNLFHI